jgi:hypothetical protein
MPGLIQRVTEVQRSPPWIDAKRGRFTQLELTLCFHLCEFE